MARIYFTNNNGDHDFINCRIISMTENFVLNPSDIRINFNITENVTAGFPKYGDFITVDFENEFIRPNLRGTIRNFRIERHQSSIMSGPIDSSYIELNLVIVPEIEPEKTIEKKENKFIPERRNRLQQIE